MEQKIETQLNKVYPNGLKGKEIIRQITEIYQAGYNLDDADFDIYKQLLVCESLAETESKERTYDTVLVNGNDTYKPAVNFQLTKSKLKVINELKQCSYKTSPFIIAELLKNLFNDPDTKPNHWLNIAQSYPPRRINLTINQMIKRQGGGWITIDKPAAYFTYLITNFRKKRKLTGINGTNKNYEK